MRTTLRKAMSMAALAAALTAVSVAAQELVCIPTCDVTDARFLAVTPPGALSSLSPARLEITIAIAGDRDEFEIGIFDGDSGLDAVGDPTSFWDFGQAEVVYRLYEDSGKDGIDPGDNLIATFASEDLPDNDWSSSGLLPAAETARADGGNFFYSLEVELLTAVSGPGIINSFKVRSSGPATIEIFQQPFAFIANLTDVPDASVVYPAFPSPTPTTYDGTFSFFLGAETSLEEFVLWDGDLDFGMADDPAVRDTDDPETPNDLTAVPFAGDSSMDIDPFATAAAFVEGIACDDPIAMGPVPSDPACRTGIGNPEEDRDGIFQVRPPAVTYTVIAPDGRSWFNPNPSGNREWERFEISTDPACVAGVTADYCETEILPAGAYEVRVEGLDMQNLNFFFFTLPLRCVNDGGSSCEELRAYVVGDTVWEDANGDGVQQPGEPGIPGVIMELVDDNGVVIERTVTEADGKYAFGVGEGDWTVRVAADNLATDPGDASLGDRVWLDGNANGQDDGEPGIPNVRVLLFDAGGDSAIGGGDDLLLAATLTDDQGLYLFSGLAPGTYYTKVFAPSLPGGLVQTGDPDEGTPCVACDGRSNAVTLAAGDSDLTLDYGYATPAGTAIVGDQVWLDADGDGVLDAGEPGIGGVTVDLIDVGGDGALGGGDDTVVATTTTAGGYYLFTGVAPGDYVVDVTDTAGVLAGYTLTAGPDSNPDPTAVFTVAAGGAILDKDFGYDTAETLYSVSDVTWFDADRDGIFDGDESAIGGVTVALANSSGDLIATSVSAAGGGFSFGNLPPGTYTILITDTAAALGGLLPTTPPAAAASLRVTIVDMDLSAVSFGYVDEGALVGWLATTPGPALIYSVPDEALEPVGSGNVLIYDFGYRLGSVGDRLWADLDGGGDQDPGEPGLEGVRVWIDLDGDGIFTPGVDRETLTGTDGIYTFDRVPGGEYTVYVDASTLPAGVAPTFDLDGIGTPDRASFTLAAGEEREDVDFGYRVICGLSVEKSCQVVPEPDDFVCSDAKPIDVLTMIWDGVETVDVKAWFGDVGSDVVDFVSAVEPGDEVSIAGFAGAPNDVVWEIFLDGSSFKLGESKFHRSCSDDQMNGPEDCGNRLGDGKSDEDGLINDWLLEGLSGSGVTLDCTPLLPPPAPLCEVTGAPVPSCETSGDPDTLTFRYTGGGCAATDNDQEPGKYICTESSPGIDGAASVTLVADDGTTVVLAPEDEVTLSRDASKEIHLSQPGRYEDHVIHVSCSQPLQAEDVYGSLTLVALDGQRAGVEVVYSYVVSNLGAPLSGVTLYDDVLGDVGGPVDLPGGASDTFEVTARLLEDTTNHVEARGETIFDIVCSAEDEATVLVDEPCFECDGGVTDLLFEYRGGSAAEVVIYDDKDPKSDKILFQGTVQPGDPIPITRRPGQDKFSSNISLWIDGVENAELHTSCSQPIGPGQIVGDFVIVEARSRNNGLICPLEICDPQSTSFETKDRELKWDIANGGDLPLVIESIAITWPAGNGELEEIKRDGDTIHKGDFAPDSALIDSGWEGNEDKRTIKVGETDTLKFKFHNDALLGDYSIIVEFDQGCSVALQVQGPFSGADFDCDKPIDSLTMVWDGPEQEIFVTAWKGDVGSTRLADLEPVGLGDELTVGNYAGSPNDVIWEIFDSSLQKIGESLFHLSCSDDDMNGPEDCGKRQGDGKGQSGFLDDWLLEGIVDARTALNCTAP